MQALGKSNEKGLSLKKVSLIMLLASVAIAVMLLVASTRTFRSFQQMKEMTNRYILLQEATTELMSASDYLTEEAQCYTVIGDRRHLENYLTESEVTCRREHAIATMEKKLPDSAALKELERAMANSMSLMNREFYAMRLVLEAKGETDYPAALGKVQLSEADLALSAGEKMELARKMVHDEAYYEEKNLIRSNMADCVTELKNGVYGEQQMMARSTRNKLVVVAGLILLQILAMFVMLWLTNHLGVNPVLRAVDHIRRDQKIPISGASEFRYLAGAYNAMYNAYKKSIESLSYKASHDELTGVYNRAGYDLIKTSLDLRSTAMLLFDVDRFKTVNDRFGHETGDEVLKKIASVLKSNFRSDDYVCRIGGDEFVVFMVHVNGEQEQLIESKVAYINQELSRADNGPEVTLSVGVSISPDNDDPREMFRQADLALYYVKDHGRNGCCFYRKELGMKKPVK